MADLVISTLEELKSFRDEVNAGNTFAGKTVELAANIDLMSEEWTPIGNNTNKFQGTFDGKGYTVSNLVITGNNSNAGFFGFTESGAIKNLTIDNASVSGYLNVGVVAGTPYTSTYSNIKLTGVIKVDGYAYVGGMFGKNLYADASDLVIDASDDSYVKANSENYRTYVGGVIGFMGEGNITVSNVASNIRVEGSTCDVGGIVGIAHYNNKFENITCTADEIKVNNDDAEVGGIAGVWHNENGTTVEMINCNISENTVVKTVVDGEETDVTETNGGYGTAYSEDKLAEGGSLLVAEAVKTEDGNIKIEFTVVGGSSENVESRLNPFVSKVVDGATLSGGISYDEDTNTYSYTTSETIVAVADGKYYTDYSAAPAGAEILFVVKQNAIYVNGAWGGQSDIDASLGTDSGVVWEQNAFASLNDAVPVAADGTEIILSGDTPILADAIDVNVNVTLSGNAVIQRNNKNFLIGYGTGDAKLTIAEGSVLDFTNNGTETDGQGIIVSDGRTENGVTDRYHGELFIDNAYVKASYFINRNITTISGDGVAVSNTANFSSSNGFYIGSRPESETGDTNVATVTINNKAFVDASGTNGILVGYEGAGALVVNDAKFVADRQNIDVASGSQIQIVDAEFTARSIANNGTVNVTGNSKLNIESLTGNVNLVDGANLSDSVIGSGTVVTTGNVTLSGNVTLDKFNAVDGEGDAGNSVTIAAGADVRLNGEVRIRTNDVVHIYGALTVGDAADFYKKNGSEMTIYKDGVLTLEDSSFQNNSLLTVYGEMNLNYVDGWAPKLAGNETGKYSGQLVVDGKDGKGIVNVKAPFLTFGGGLGSAWKEAADGCTVDILNNGKIVTDAKAFWNSSKNTLTLNHGSLIFDAANSAYDSVWQADAKFDNDGVMSGSNSSVIDMSDRTFTNNGSVTLADSTLTAGTLVNNSTVNVSGADSAVKAVFSGSGSTVFTDVAMDADWAVSGSQGEWRFLGDSTVAQAMVFGGRVYAGTLQTADETDFSGVASSTLAINADFSASALWIGAQYADGITDSKTSTVTVNSGSVLTVDGESSGLVIRESGILNIIDGSSLKIGHDRQVMIQGALTVDGAGSLFETASSPVNIYKDHAVLTVSNGGKAVFGSYNDTNIRIGNSGEIVLKSGILVLNDTLNINENGSFSMDYLSTVSFAETINVADTASLTIDTTGFTDGIYKLMDYTGTGSYSEEQYKVLLGSNWDDAYYSVIDSDLYLMNVDMTTVKVDAAWAGSEFGAEVEDDYYYGFNAFSDFAESVQVLASKPDTTTTFLLKGNLTTTDDLEIPYGSGDVKFLSADGNEVVVEGLTNDKSNFSFTEGGVSPVITIGENVTFKMLGNNSDFSVWYGANLDLYGTLQGVGGWNALYQYVGTANVYSTGSITMGRIQAPSAQVNIYGTSENMAGETVSRYSSDLAVKDRADAQVKVSNLFVEADPWGSSTTKKGEFNAYDTFVSAGTVHDSNNGTVRGDGTVAFTIDHSKFVASSITLKRTDTVFALQNGSYVEVSSNLDNSGLISMDYTSTLAFGSLVNSGTITVDTAGFSSGVYKIFDDLTGSYTETEYRSLLGDANWNDSYQVIDNDLYLTNLEGAELYVDSAWASMSLNEEVTFVDGTKAYYKLNAFDTVANALALPTGETAYENAVKLNITGAVKSNISVIGSNITEVNSAAKTADENAVIAEDALTVNLVQVDNTEAGWEVYYPLAAGSAASVYGGITTNFVSGLFTFETTRDPNIIGGAYGASDAKIYGSTTVNIGTDGGADSDVDIYVDALVGSGGGTVNGNSSVNIYSGTIDMTGSIIGGSSWGGVVKGDSSVNIYGGTITDSSDGKSKRGIMGGSYNGVTEGNASVNIYGGTVNGRIYAGGSQAGTTVKGNASVNISDGVVNGSIYGTGGVVEGSISISVTGGTVNGDIYAGGYNAGAGNTSIDITGGSVSGNIYGGSFVDASSSTVNSVGDVEIKIENLSASGSRVFGGGKTLKNGVLEADMTEGDAVINIMDNVTLKSVHGGTWVRNYTSDDAQTASQAKAFVKSSNITIDGASSTVSKVFGGGMTSGNGTGALSTVGSSTINLKNGSVGELYGGGWANYFHSTAIGSEDGTATDDTLVRINISGGSADYVYGGGLADVADFSADGDGGGRDTSVNGSVEINISGGSVGEVYGGGFANSWSTYDERFKSPSSTVTGNVAINISGGTVTGDVYGGGNTYNIDSENVNVTSVVNGNVTVTITGGTVSGDIYGGGKEEATVNGSRTLNLGSADAAAYAATLNNVYDFNVAQIVNADVTVTGDFSVEEITIAGATLTLNSGFLAATTAVAIEVGAYNVTAAALNVGVSGVNQPSITISAAEELTAGRYLVASGFDSLSGFTVDGINGYTLRLQGEDVYLTRDLAPDDYDANGRPDILMQHDIGKLQVSLVQEDQSVILKDVADLGDGWTILGSGQSGNGENYADIYLTNGETVGIWQLDETTGVAAWQEIQSFDSATHVLGLGDFNGDGITDLLLQNDNGAVGAYLTDGENVGWNYFQSLGSEWSIAGIGDFNHDGIDDVVLQNEQGGYAGIWQLDRDGQVSWSDLDVLNNGQIAGTGDFNGDGFDDVLLKWGNSYGAWTVSGGNLSGWMDLGTLWDSAALEQIGDFNGDGIDDLRVRITNGDLGAFCVLGEGNLQWNYHFSVGSEWQTNLVSI